MPSDMNFNDPTIQYIIGSYLFEKEDDTSDVEAIEWLKKAAEQGHSGAQYKLSVCFYNGFGVEKNDIEADKWCKKAVEQNHPGALATMGMIFRLQNDDVSARTCFQKAAELGHTFSTDYIEFMNTHG